MIALMIAQCFMAYIFIVIYSVLFGLFNFGPGLGLLNLASASTSASSVWPRPRPRPRGSGLGLDLGLKHLASFNISIVYVYNPNVFRVPAIISIWPWCICPPHLVDIFSFKPDIFTLSKFSMAVAAMRHFNWVFTISKFGTFRHDGCMFLEL